MKISEKAKEYAEGKAMNALTSAIETAYADGYNAGYSDALASKKDETPDDLVVDGVEYVDLGLPSGTQWAYGYLKDKDGKIVCLSYEEAAKLNIPTKEQYEELVNNSRILTNVSPNDIIVFSGHGYNLCYAYVKFFKSRHVSMFWLKSNNNQEKSLAACMCREVQSSSEVNSYYKLPVILVK